MPDTQNLDSYNFKQNPFMEMTQLAAAEAPQQAEGPQMGAAPSGMPPQGGGMPGQGGGMEQPEDQMMKGQNPDKTKFLIGAVNSLETYIKESEDMDEISTARGIIMLLSRLMAKDQESMAGLMKLK